MRTLFIFSLIIIFLSGVVIFFIPDKKKIEPTEKIQTLKNLSELATAEYLVTKIVKHTDENLFGDRKILFETSAVLKAGVDLSELKDNDFIVKQDSVSLFLPQPQLLSLNMKPDSIKERYVKTGWLRKGFSNKEKDKILTAGEKSIRDNIKGIGILGAAKENTRVFLETWLRLAGFTHINIYFREKETIKSKKVKI